MAHDLLIVGIGGTLRSHSTNRMALERSLTAAARAGAATDLLDLNRLNLPMYVPDLDLDAFGPNVHHFLDLAHRADALLWSTGAYHGTLAGVTKNAIDFLEFLSDVHYLNGKPVGLIATASSEMDAANAINAMSHAVHALRGVTVPYVVPIPRAKEIFGKDGSISEEKWARRLDRLGEQVVEMARKLNRDLKRVDSRMGV